MSYFHLEYIFLNMFNIYGIISMLFEMSILFDLVIRGLKIINNDLKVINYLK